MGGTGRRTRAARAPVARGPRRHAPEPRPAGARPRPRPRGRAPGVRRGREARQDAAEGHRPRPVPGHQRQQGPPPLRRPGRVERLRLDQRVREAPGAGARGAAARARRLLDAQDRPPGQGPRRLEPEQRQQDDRRPVLAARARRALRRGAAHVARAGRPRAPPPADGRGPGPHEAPQGPDGAPRPPRGSQPRRRDRPAAGVPVQARRASHPRTGPGRPRPEGFRRGPSVRRPRAPREQPALGPAARARRRAALLGPAQGNPRRPEAEPARGPHRGPPARVRDLRGHDPEGRVRRRRVPDLGHRRVRHREVERRRGHRDPARQTRRRPGRGAPPAGPGAHGQELARTRHGPPPLSRPSLAPGLSGRADAGHPGLRR